MRNDLRNDQTESARPAPSAIDGFDIIRELATGGMGTVYEARQRRPDRLVALKLLKHAAVSRSAMRRFEFETQALAQLEHPGIARIFHAGTHDDGSGGVPYFVMELVHDARDITQYCNEQQLSHRERLHLFADVCDAVHHGHQKRIIHRDLKPSNILVNADGQPKIIDFGIALSTDSDLTATTLTDAGHIIGTLAYMSPEQCTAATSQIDTTTDVYALGVVLYELLCGQLPYEIEGKMHTQVARTIEEQPPTPPSAVRRELRGDIDAILLNALSKDQRRRYQSAAEFAEDIRRHLRREPITARPPSRWQKAAQWIGRHPAMTTAAGCLTLIIVSLIVTLISIWYLRMRPHQLVVSTDGSRAQVLSFSGTLLREWVAPTDSVISGLPLIDSMGSLEGHRLAILGFTYEMPPPFGGSVCAFDASQASDQPIWTRRLTDQDLPASLLSETRTFNAEQFDVAHISHFDIFTTVPGPEIIVVFAHRPLSPRCLRIYSLEGDLLYQVWHDGTLNKPMWLQRHQLLVFTGDNKEMRWSERGFDTDAYPSAICTALRPTLGHFGSEFVRSTPPFDVKSTVVWYKALHPPGLAIRFIAEGPFLPPAASDRENYVRIHFVTASRAMHDAIGFSFLIGFDGRLKDNSLRMNEEYRFYVEEAMLPDPNELYLADLPLVNEYRSADENPDIP